MPTIAEFSQPFVRAAGYRLNPVTNGAFRPNFAKAITLKRVADGIERQVTVPTNPRLTWVGFSPDGKRFAFTHTGDTGVYLWIGDSNTGDAKAIAPAAVNTAFGLGVDVGGKPCEWVGTGELLLCPLVLPDRGAPPTAPNVPSGPNIQEHRGAVGPVRTFQDLLGSAHDEALFEYYATSQLAWVDPTTGQQTKLGSPGILRSVRPSPDGNYVVVSQVHRPYSWRVPYARFPTTIEVWDRQGRVVRRIADVSVADTVPNGGVPAGARGLQWQPLAPATLTWVEALDGGDPKVRVPHRDRILTLAAPFTDAAVEMAKTEFRYGGLSWTDTGIILLSENDLETRWTRTWLIDGPATTRKLWDRGIEHSYSDPGSPQRRAWRSGTSIVRQSGNAIFLAGAGAAPDGARPFLDRVDLTTLTAERLFEATPGTYEMVAAMVSDCGRTILTRCEAPLEPPKVSVIDLQDNTRRPITNYQRVSPRLEGAQRRLVTYKRSDGVDLSATIITPAGWIPGHGRLPTVLWAYPKDFLESAAAGQVTSSPNRYTAPAGPSHLFFLLHGYAIIDDPSMPIIGPGQTANDTYVQQLVAGAQAAVDTAVSMGVTDRDRIVVGGHSYGAFMTAGLLAHSAIFRAGIALSGAYNRTLTPFGFQNERRSFWDAPEVYSNMSPFNYAHRIAQPLLLIHGEADDNVGTFPMQSERFYMALKGNGATVRYVNLPHEGHKYAARESVLHAIAEMLNWADEFTKHAAPLQPKAHELNGVTVASKPCL